MKRFIAICSCLLGASTFGQHQTVVDALDQQADRYQQIARTIWENPELGYQEHASSALLQETLQGAGFKVQANVAGMPTAFVAERGSGKPIIGFLAEYDALPGASQSATPARQVLTEGGAGHACGHHLFGVGSVAAAIAVADWMQANGVEGTIRVYGTPAEEGGSGKVYMARSGLVDDVDVMLHWHPASYNAVRMLSSLANISAKFRFYGEATHASGSPERGRSALDAVEAMNFMVNMMREHVPEKTRMHYVITSGGNAPNVVPDFAESYHYVRHPDAAQTKEIFQRLVLAAEGAALGTQTRMEYEIIGGVHSVLINESLAAIMQKHLERVGGIHYNAEETAFAEGIIATLPKTVRNKMKPEQAHVVMALEPAGRAAPTSTDVGDISWLVPTVGLRTATWVPGTTAHSWQATAAGGTTIGTKGMMTAAKVMALTAIDILEQPEAIRIAREEFERQRGAQFVYEPLVGEREPPLDYQNR